MEFLMHNLFKSLGVGKALICLTTISNFWGHYESGGEHESRKEENERIEKIPLIKSMI